MYSPETAPKESPHVPVKCGYRCQTCGQSHIMEDKILATTCPSGEKHSLVKRAIMCQNCHDTSDDLETFMKETCEGCASPPPLQDTDTKAKAKVPHLPEHWSSMPVVVTKRARVAMDLENAEKEMGRLLLLKGLQAERLKLQELLAAKHQRKTGEPGSKVEQS